ncbi:EAF domain-containing protein [Citrus sinensis]|uniref:suppressor protein SRP40 isoform X2 n=1 Tax=Citrus sinensis TaxID=2711 RepID=UPI0003D759F2|nr:suppressor protein SRP40 isoform X2 [Citrus sinensis]KAH9675588.1 EAF domain-containing protein [Citrus sinensis]
MANNSEEPSTAPEPGQWYNIKLGPSFNDNHHQQSHHSPKFCTLRYEFKPASIDNNQPGLLHKNRDNRVTVEYQNNQHGKPKVIFEGVSEDYRDNDAVLFFDGETFRLERLHRAVKRLRHVRLPGEPAATAASTITTSVVPVAESYSTPVGKGSKPQPSNTGTVHEAVQVEQIDIGNSGNSESKSGKDRGSFPPLPNPSTSSPEPKNFEPEENVDIVDDSDDSCEAARGSTYEKESRTGLDIDINLPHQMDMDDEIAVDVSDDYPDKGPNAAEALRAQVNAEGREESSSSSSSSDSESTGTESGSGSGSESASVSTSTDSESSGADSVNSI